MYTIGKLSKHTGVTVRTLDYYDEIGLVKPSSKTEGGHRLYTDDDVMRLERVLALKYMGFSLEQIKNILETSTTTWLDSIEEQLEMVRREQERLKVIEKALLGVSFSIKFEGKVNWPIIFNTIQMFQGNPLHVFEPYKQFLDDEKMEKLVERNNLISEAQMEEWIALIQTMKKNLHMDPTSVEAQQLVEKWLSKSQEMFGDDEELLGDLWEALQHLKEGTAFYPMDKDVIDFIQRVITANDRI